MPANMKRLIGMPALIPILAEVGEPEELGEWLALGPELELGVVDFALGEDVAAEGEITDRVAVELIAEAGFTALLELKVVVVELVKEIVGVDVVDAGGFTVEFVSTVLLLSRPTDLGAEVVDEKVDVLAVVARTLDGLSVPHVLQVCEPGLVRRH